MQKVAIVVDSIACLPPEAIDEYRIKIVPINIHFDGKIYRNGVDITAAEAYALLERAPDLFASSPASAGEYLEAYRQAKTYAESVICFTLSAKLSTAFDMACVAREEAKQRFPGVEIEVFDTRTAAGGEGLIVLAAAREAAAGGDLTKVIKTVTSIRDRVMVIGVMDTIRYVYRTGRIPKVTSLLGSALGIRPLFTISGGVVQFHSLARSREQGINRALALMRKKVGSGPVHVALAHADVPEVGENLKARISSEFNCVELWLTDFSPVMSYATGTGVVAIAFYTDS